MQPYRNIRPHKGADCPECAPNRAGHPQCQADGCDKIATTQTKRHATQAEYDALPEGLRPIDGVARQRVDACDDHADQVPVFCSHTIPDPVPCPKCGANGDGACVTALGTARPGPHADRVTAQPPLEHCAHAHREDCAVFANCACTGDDLNPVRAPRIVSQALDMDLSGITVSPQQAALFAMANGIDLTRAKAVRNMFTQDGRPAFAVDLRQVDAKGNTRFDQHGREMTEMLVIPLDTAKF